ncbi:MAG TPA: nucleotidyltransferase domain-containing protein [Candidatus Acidoferrum sp.]|nr:nucleotidyltransferase domain-containing protein [Candidatus Acidoferrum sp.]
MDDAQEALKNLVERLHEAARDNLESIILYGSGARDDFHQGHSDLNVLCILRSLRVADLARVSPVVKWWNSVLHQPAPLFFSADELRRSADVFAIELLDMQRSHRLLFGSDFISGLAVPMNLHRLQVEHELRTLALKLRQHFLRDAENRKELAAVLVQSFSGALTLLRHTLIAFQQQPPDTPSEIFRRIAALTGANGAAFDAVSQMRAAKNLDQDAVPAVYDGYLAALETVIVALDHHLPKHQWQRAAKTSA